MLTPGQNKHADNDNANPRQAGQVNRLAQPEPCRHGAPGQFNGADLVDADLEQELGAGVQ